LLEAPPRPAAEVLARAWLGPAALALWPPVFGGALRGAGAGDAPLAAARDAFVPDGAVVTAGVRVLPRRTHLGKLPVAGRVPELLPPHAPPGEVKPGTAASAAAEAATAAADDKGGKGGKRQDAAKSRVWVLTGLGSRGLIHHAYLADCLARALLDDDDNHLPREVRPF
jgi:hypothetical protein